MICSICGSPITGNHSIDHIYPREFAKWIDDPKVKSVINGKANRAPAHRSCNYQKQDAMPDPEKVYISDKQKSVLRQEIAGIQSQMQEHLERKHRLIEKQEGKCYRCGILLDGLAILRRIDRKRARSWDNACIVCSSCNETHRDFV